MNTTHTPDANAAKANGDARLTTEKETANNGIERKIVSEDDKSTKNVDDVSGRKRGLQPTPTKERD